MENDNGFMPAGYEVPKGDSNYLKFQDGENRFRIMSQPIIGWLDWDGKNPLRYAMDNKPEHPIDRAKPIKHFWAMVVYNCLECKIQILEITQSGIQKTIQSHANNKDWGNPIGYDITVKKKGSGKETEYTTIMSPPKPIDVLMKNAFESRKINLNALFTNSDPFAA